MPQMYMTTSPLIAFQFKLIQDGENLAEWRTIWKYKQTRKREGI